MQWLYADQDVGYKPKLEQGKGIRQYEFDPAPANLEITQAML